MVANDFATYAYDAGGRIRSLTQHLRASSNAGNKGLVSTVPLTWSVDYDSRNRIIGFSRPGSEAHYTYDANSNRITASRRSIRDSDHDGGFEGADFAKTEIQHATIDAASNRLLGLTMVKTVSPHGEDRAGDSSGHNIVYTVDANGAITSDGKRQFEYDAANRLARLTLQSDGETVHIRYLHNALGQRVFKGEPVADQAIPDAATLGAGFVEWLRSRFGWMFSQAGAATMLGTAYVWGDGDIPPWALLGEYDNGSAGGKGRTEYVWLPLEGGSAIPVAFFRGGRFYAVHTDHLGSPRLVTDDANEPVWQWPYSAFGEVEPVGVVRPKLSELGAKRASQSIFTSPLVMDLRFPGQLSDRDAASFYNNFRDYDAQTSRYREADLIGLMGGLNRFSYAAANTLGVIDPSGLDPVVCLFPGAAGFGHVGVGVNSRVTQGFYPQEGAAGNPITGTAGQVLIDPKPPIYCVTIPATSEQDALMKEFMRMSVAGQSPSDYALLANNCTDYVRAVLAIGGISVPPAGHGRGSLWNCSREDDYEGDCFSWFGGYCHSVDLDGPVPRLASIREVVV